MKILMLCTTGGVVNGFRRDLISSLQARGHQVVVVANFANNRDF